VLATTPPSAPISAEDRYKNRVFGFSILVSLLNLFVKNTKVECAIVIKNKKQGSAM
jgi:hypothetical protein